MRSSLFLGSLLASTALARPATEAENAWPWDEPRAGTESSWIGGGSKDGQDSKPAWRSTQPDRDSRKSQSGSFGFPSLSDILSGKGLFGSWTGRGNQQEGKQSTSPQHGASPEEEARRDQRGRADPDSMRSGNVHSAPKAPSKMTGLQGGSASQAPPWDQQSPPAPPFPPQPYQGYPEYPAGPGYPGYPDYQGVQQSWGPEIPAGPLSSWGQLGPWGDAASQLPPAKGFPRGSSPLDFLGGWGAQQPGYPRAQQDGRGNQEGRTQNGGEFGARGSAQKADAFPAAAAYGLVDPIAYPGSQTSRAKVPTLTTSGISAEYTSAQMDGMPAPLSHGYTAMEHTSAVGPDYAYNPYNSPHASHAAIPASGFSTERPAPTLELATKGNASPTMGAQVPTLKSWERPSPSAFQGLSPAPRPSPRSTDSSRAIPSPVTTPVGEMEPIPSLASATPWYTSTATPTRPLPDKPNVVASPFQATKAPPTAPSLATSRSVASTASSSPKFAGGIVTPLSYSSQQSLTSSATTPRIPKYSPSSNPNLSSLMSPSKATSLPLSSQTYETIRPTSQRTPIPKLQTTPWFTTPSSTVAQPAPAISVPPLVVANRARLWQPAVAAPFQIVLSGNIDVKGNLEPAHVNIWDLDMFGTPKSTVDELHKKGKKVICYFSAGSSEDWRPDYKEFAYSDLGNKVAKDAKGVSFWAGERWLNIKNPNPYSSTLPNVWKIMRNRIKMAAEKGCDAVDPDNMDGYDNTNGLFLSQQDSISFMKFMSDEALRYNMSIGLKNSIQILSTLNPYIQFAVNEECASMNECSGYSTFIGSKPVFHIEYVKRNRGSGLGELFGSSTSGSTVPQSSAGSSSASSGLGSLFGWGQTGGLGGLSSLGSLFGWGSQTPAVPAAAQTSGTRASPGSRGGRGNLSGGFGSLLGSFFNWGAPKSTAAPVYTAAPQTTAAPKSTAAPKVTASAQVPASKQSPFATQTTAAPRTSAVPYPGNPGYTKATAAPLSTAAPASPWSFLNPWRPGAPAAPAASASPTSILGANPLGLVAAGVGGILSGVYTGVTGLIQGLGRADELGGPELSGLADGTERLLAMIEDGFARSEGPYNNNTEKANGTQTTASNAGLLAKLSAFDALGDDVIIKNACNPGFGLGNKFSTVVKTEALDGWVRFCDGRVMVTRVTGSIRGGTGRFDAESSEPAREFSDNRESKANGTSTTAASGYGLNLGTIQSLSAPAASQAHTAPADPWAAMAAEFAGSLANSLTDSLTDSLYPSGPNEVPGVAGANDPRASPQGRLEASENKDEYRWR